MSPDFSALQDIAKRPGPKPGWEPLTRDMLATGEVLAFDQSLSSTGWVLVRNNSYLLDVTSVGMIGGKREILRGFEQDLTAGTDLYEQVREILPLGVFADVVHEHPPMGGKVKGMGTSSLLAALSVRIAARSMGREVIMLGAQPAKKMICGEANADKKVAHQALSKCASWIEGYDTHVTNEHKRDALLIALLRLYQKKRAQDGAVR